MKKYIIKNADGREQTVMQAVHNSRKEAGETLMDYICDQNIFLNIDDDDYLSPFDFVLEEVECKEVNEVITDFDKARKALGGKPNADFTVAKKILSGNVVQLEDVARLVTDINPNRKQKYKEDVTAALWALRTKQKIEESFPEALPYLDFDDGKTNLPVPKYEELRNLLKKIDSNVQLRYC